MLFDLRPASLPMTDNQFSNQFAPNNSSHNLSFMPLDNSDMPHFNPLMNVSSAKLSNAPTSVQPGITKQAPISQPAYSGEPSVSTLNSWLNYWDDYFLSMIGHSLSDTQKTQIAAQNLRASARVWYRSLNTAFKATPPWPDFKKAIAGMFLIDSVYSTGVSVPDSSEMLTHHQQQHGQLNMHHHHQHHLSAGHGSHQRSSSAGSDPESLPDLHQDGSVSDYTTMFKRSWVSLPMGAHNEEALVSKYIAGLDMDLRRAVSAHAPRTLSQAIQLAYDGELNQHPIGYDMVSSILGAENGQGNALNAAPGSPGSVNTMLSGSNPASSTSALHQQFGSPSPGKLMMGYPSTMYNAPQQPQQPQQLTNSLDAKNMLSENLHKLTPEERERLKKEGGCFRCRQLGHQKDQCPLLAMGNNVVPPPSIMNLVQQQNLETSLVNIPKLTPEERDRLRKFGGCYRCRRLGHQKENCPMNLSQLQLASSETSDEEI